MVRGCCFLQVSPPAPLTRRPPAAPPPRLWRRPDQAVSEGCGLGPLRLSGHRLAARHLGRTHLGGAGGRAGGRGAVPGKVSWRAAGATPAPTQPRHPNPPRPACPPQFLKAASVDGAVVVSTPQQVSIIDVRKEINFCRKVGRGGAGGPAAAAVPCRRERSCGGQLGRWQPGATGTARASAAGAGMQPRCCVLAITLTPAHVLPILPGARRPASLCWVWLRT